MDYQEWYCKECGTRDRFVVHSYEGPILIASHIEEAHRKKSPDCPISKDPEGWKKLSDGGVLPRYG